MAPHLLGMVATQGETWKGEWAHMAEKKLTDPCGTNLYHREHKSPVLECPAVPGLI